MECLQNQFEPAISESIGPVQSLIAPNHLAEFIWKGWIAFESEVLQDSTVANFYSWGPRAKATIDRMKLLEAFCRINGSECAQWKYHLQDATNASSNSAETQRE
ncbi:unnamed protein product [Anisakis simplex]|uniref:MAGE domain-containing protein n=1 Tax=Anisakis simplex TaxID=6269 RepID=A0A0M3J3V3_ANISI|nr:unnamed protein product [Anisakis simplex]